MSGPPDDDPVLIRMLLAARRAIERGAEPDEAVAALRSAGWDVEGAWLRGWLSESDASDMAQRLVAARATRSLARPELTRDELIEAVRRASPGDVLYREADAAWWSAVFESQVSLPHASNLIFYPPEGAPDPWDAAAVVDYARRHRPIAL